MSTKIRLGQDKAKHAYELGVDLPGGGIGRIEVLANNRTQAAAIARKAGHSVRDVNMVG